MIVPYAKFPSSVPSIKAFWRPILDIKLISAGKSIRVAGLVDSGCDYTLVNKDLAIPLGLIWTAGMQTEVRGIADVPLPLYLHDVEIEITNLTKSRRKIQIGFVDFPKVTVLLGQIGFFENYVVRFKRNKCIFDVDIA